MTYIPHTRKCLICKKQKGYHQARSLHCPVGSKTRIGYTSFSTTDVFVPDKPSKKELETKCIF